MPSLIINFYFGLKKGLTEMLRQAFFYFDEVSFYLPAASDIYYNPETEHRVARR